MKTTEIIFKNGKRMYINQHQDGTFTKGTPCLSGDVLIKLDINPHSNVIGVMTFDELMEIGYEQST
jgi:hypothetical protein